MGITDCMDALLQKSAVDIFKSLDTNGDGILDKAEVRVSLANFGYSEDEMDQIINSLDKDGDGTISFQEFLCNFCEEAVGAFFCEQCEANLCEACSTQLHSKGAWKGHLVKPIIGGKVEKRRHCPEHPDEYVTQVCVSCLALCCAHCFLDGKHSAHQSRDVDLVYDEVKTRVQKKVAAVQSQVIMAKEALSDVAAAQSELDEAGEALKANITTGCARIRSTANDKLKACVRVLEDAKGTKSVALYEQQKDMERKRDRLAVGAANAEKALALSKDNQFEFIQDAPQLESDLVILEELDVVLRGGDPTIECAINFEPMERAIKQLELRSSTEAAESRAPALPARSNMSASSVSTRAPPSTNEQSTGPKSAMTRSALNPSTPSRKTTTGVAATMTPCDNLSKSAIYVNSLPTDAKEADIIEAFKECGGIKMVNARHIATGGFAFVFFDSDDGAQKALEQARVEVKGKTVNVLAKKQIPGA